LIQETIVETVLITGGTVIDGSGAKPQAGVDVLLKEGRIAEVGKSLTQLTARQQK
jgi:N-acyl-D-aspartate/D-glutamate deacylase